MAARPIANTAKLLLTHTSKRTLRISIPPDHPSLTLTSSSASSKKTALSTSEDATPATRVLGKREFNTSRANKAVGDTSTIDFAFFPDVGAEGTLADKRPAGFGVPIISAIYSGQHVRPIGEEQSEDEIKEMHSVFDPSELHIVGGASTHPVAPMRMGEVEDVNFQGIFAPSSLNGPSASGPSDTTIAGSLKHIWNGLLDDLQGKK